MAEERSLNFLEEIIENDLNSGKYTEIVTRFPPEPNGYLHLGHASSICLNFGLTKSFPGYTNLRFDDTNPVTEETEYVESIKTDVRWLGFEWKHERYASDYFDTLFDYACKLIDLGLAYVDDLSPEQMAAQKGTPTEPGVNSPFRNRSIEENRALFLRMKAGEFPDGTHTLRAKIDMAHINMRSSIASSMHIIIVRATSGASIRCMILHTGKVIPSKTSPIPFVRWSSCPTASCTIG